MRLLVTLVFLSAGWLTSAHADTVTVTASGFSFAPSAVTIQLGDTVHWQHISGSHTATSGTGAGDPNVGALFSSPLSFGSPNFFYTFADTAGVYPFHCTPHEFLNMKGTVTVEAPITVGVPTYSPSWSELKELFQ